MEREVVRRGVVRIIGGHGAGQLEGHGVTDVIVGGVLPIGGHPGGVVGVLDLLLGGRGGVLGGHLGVSHDLQDVLGYGHIMGIVEVKLLGHVAAEVNVSVRIRHRAFYGDVELGVRRIDKLLVGSRIVRRPRDRKPAVRDGIGHVHGRGATAIGDGHGERPALRSKVEAARQVVREGSVVELQTRRLLKRESQSQLRAGLDRDAPVLVKRATRDVDRSYEVLQIC